MSEKIKKENIEVNEEWTTEDEATLNNLLVLIENTKARIEEIDKQLESEQEIEGEDKDAKEDTNETKENEITEESKGELQEIKIEEIIEGNISEKEKEKLAQEFPNENIVQKIETEVIKDLNIKNPKTLEKQDKKGGAMGKIRAKTRKLLMYLLAVSFFETNTSFSYQKSADAITYEKIEVNDLKDWENIKLDEEKLNKLDNLTLINKAREGKPGKYLVVDKAMGLAHLFEYGNLISTYEVGVGENPGDEQTETVAKGGRVYWALGNKKTGAGIYTINKKNRYGGLPSFTMLNERGIEVPTVLHKTTSERKKLFHDGNIANNRMSNGCVNFQAHDLNHLSKQEGFGHGVKIYILPDDPSNKFKIIDGELRFVSNQEKVNRTIKKYTPLPIILKAEDINDSGREFLQNIADNKNKLMNLYPTVSNDVYNRLAKKAYGIFGQESSFGTYGMVRGHMGKIGDVIGAELGKNISAGVTQIRITSINSKIKKAFNIKTTKDLFDIKKSSIATMSMLLDIYTESIPNNRKVDYETLVPICYNSPTNFKNLIEKGEKVNSKYLENVNKYSEKVKVYVSNY